MASASSLTTPLSIPTISNLGSSSQQNTPLANFKRSAKSQEGRRKRQKPHLQTNYLPDQSEGYPHSAAPTADQLDTAITAEEAEDESLDHVIMAIDNRERDTVGCAYYVARQQSLMCLEDVTGGGKEVLELLKLDIQPTILLVSPRIDLEADKDDLLQSAGRASAPENDENPLPYRIEFRPAPEFGYDGALNKLANMPSFYDNGADLQFLVPGESNFEPGQAPDDFGTTNRQGRLLQMSACINLESRTSIGCLGAVIIWIQRKRASEYLQDDPAADRVYRIMEVNMFSLKDTMLINPDTLVSLQILQPESHPNAFNQGSGTSGSKESLSIYGLFHHLARTPQGRARLRRLFLRPSLDLADINARLNFVSIFVQPDNIIPLKRLSKSMSRIKNMRTTITMLHKGVSGGNKKLGGFKSGIWASLLEFCYHAIDIAETLKEILGAENISLRARAMDILDTFQLQRIGKMIHDVVDLEASIEQHRTVARRGIDEELDEIKNVYDGIEELLSEVAIKVARDVPGYIKLNVIYFPQLGFHITVPINEDTGQPVYDGGAEQWQRMFTTQNQVYFKDVRMREMDEQLGDLYAMICDIEIEISYELAQNVLQDEGLLIAASEICGEIDALLALAHGAVQYKLTRPRLTQDNVIIIKAGRHLLQEMCVASYVPNDTHIVGGQLRDAGASDLSQELADEPSMLLLTGPNYSGKSVYMKSVALITYMAHLGCFVPCASATIGITDKILTRITTRETVSRDQSTFMIELQQVATAITQCTRRSLVVIDEFGKGTESFDGAGLASGVIRYLLDKADEERPKCLIATHFHEVFEVDDGLPKFESYQNLGLRHMEVLLDHKTRHEASQHESQVTYLYNLIEGRSNLSYGTQCAAMNGIPPSIVRRATQLADLSVKGEDLVRVCAAISDQEQKDFEEAENAARDFLMLDLIEGREESLVESLRRISASGADATGSSEQRSDRSETLSRIASAL